MNTGIRRRRIPFVVAIAALLSVLVAPIGAAGGVSSADVACPPGEVPGSGFGDTGAPHAAAVDCLAWYGLVEGTAPGIFAPRSPVLRGQAASIGLRLLNQLDGVELPDPTARFSDVHTGPHRTAIETLASFTPPVVAGFPDGTFVPYRAISRGQLASILARLLDEIAAQAESYDPLPGAADYAFTDPAPAAHRDAIARLAAAGIISGFPDGTFRSATPVAREQAASMVARTLDGLVEAGLLAVPDTDPDPGPDPIPDLDVELTLTEVATIEAPISGAVGPDGQLYIASRVGTVHPLTDDGLGDAVVDISELTTPSGERGLLSIEFAADGSELYLSYTDLDGDTVIEAFAVEEGVVDPEERRIVYTHVRPRQNHNGGDIHIGPDGMLYFGHGDSGGGGDPDDVAQDLSSALGSMLRIDPLGGDPYAVPADNPFVGEEGVVEEIWAYGLRNPWRFSFDRLTGDLWIADVGQVTREEINFVPAGQGAGVNFGWDRMEGTLEHDGGPEPDNHYPPIYEYETRGPEGCAITGGYVYRGEAIEGLAGAYLYSDFCESYIRGLSVVDGEVYEQADLGIEATTATAFAQDADGELYVLDLDGRVLRIDPAT